MTGLLQELELPEQTLDIVVQPEKKKKRTTVGVRLPSAAARPQTVSSGGDYAQDEPGWDGLDAGLPAQEGGEEAPAAAAPPAAAPLAGSGNCSLPERAGWIPSAAAGARAAQEQLKWDAVRPELQRCYVQYQRSVS